MSHTVWLIPLEFPMSWLPAMYSLGIVSSHFEIAPKNAWVSADRSCSRWPGWVLPGLFDGNASAEKEYR